MTQFSDLNSAEVVAKVGETDQQYLASPSPALAKDRAQLRLRLVELSNHKQEQLYFLTEAVVLLETALMEANELEDHIELSAALGETYLTYYDLTKEKRYLIITKQVVKPLSHHAHPLILIILIRLSALEGHFALVRHWMTRLVRLPTMHPVQLDDIHNTKELSQLAQEDWFKQLLKQKLH